MNRIESISLRLYIETNKGDYIETFELGEYDDNETLEAFYERVTKRCAVIVEVCK